MALINLDNNITVEKLKKAFKTETGLDLIVFFNEAPAPEDIQIYQILGRRRLLRCDFRHTHRINDFYYFDYSTYVEEFKNDILELFGLKVDLSFNDTILDETRSLSDYIPDSIKKRRYKFNKVDAINERLIQIEKDIYARWLKLKTALDRDLTDADDWLSDYEIELKIVYYIDESDHLYEKNTDSILITREFFLGKGETIGDMINDGEDHTEPIFTRKFTSPHCFTFHDLYDHSCISFEEIERIGDIWIDINVTLQHCYDIAGTPDIEKDKTKNAELFQINKTPSDSMTFENFYVCRENQMAYNTSKMSIQSPPDLINPLVIYGETGTGKTHLLNAIMAKYLDDASNLKIFYTTASEFTSEFINSIMKNTQREFSKKYQALDVFIIDDFEFFEKKEETQNEFYRIMCSLLIQNKKVIISSGKKLSKLLTISDRLKSRLKQGYISQLKYPDYESRRGFLSSDIFQPHTELSDELLKTIASKIIEFGTLKSFITNLKIMKDSGEVLTNDLVEEEIKKYIQPES